MIETLASETAVPLSITKIVLCLLLLLGWAKWAAVVNKDAGFYHLGRRLWNGAQTAAAVLAFAAILWIPIFILGFILGVGILVGAAVGYVYYRNGQVAERHRWHFDVASLQEQLAQRRQNTAMAEATLRFPKAPNDLKAAPLPEDSHYDPHMLLEQLMEPALRQKAQRIELAGTEAQFQAKLSVDGVDYPQGKFEASSAISLIDYLKRQCGLDISDRRRKQVGSCRVDMEDFGEHNLQIRTAGSTRGVSCTIEIDPTKQRDIRFEQLGLLDRQAEQLKEVIEQPGGVVPVCAPAEQGRTTTLYALLEQQDPYIHDIHSLEPEIERELEGISQHEIPAENLAKRLDSMLLRDPEMVMISELAEPAVAQSAARASTQGKRIYAGLQASDLFSGLKKWMKAVGDADLGSRSLSAVVHQRLFRKLCEFCRQQYTPDPAVLKKLNLPADRIQALYKPGGQVIVKNKPEPCPVCQGIGYSGRTAAFEVAVLDEEARRLLGGGRLQDLRTHLRRQKTTWLQEAALSKLVQGVTSVKEVMRVLNAEQGSKGQGKGKAEPQAQAQAQTQTQTEQPEQ
jgi:type II secretory ATPase GspE/PulE/Tfp pilus assembly ATPase PilB-like protein